MENKLEYAIQVRDLKKAYKDKEVLKCVTFQVEKGSVFCLLGSNGSGKTTTVKILSTLLQKDGGSAEINGFHVDKEERQVRQAISLTGQFAAVDEILTGRENMEMTARLCHLKDFKHQSDNLLRAFHLEDAADKRVCAYSGGMCRRLDIAMSLIGNPSVIFLDEPTTGLDPQSRNAMWNIVKELKNKGVTIFLTTQYLEEAEQLADRVAILHDGVIIANGTVNEIKQLSSREYIVFSFTQPAQLDKMKQIFQNQITSANDEEQTVTIEVANGMKQISDIFITMQQQNIISTSFSQKKATLEDVFLHLVDESESECRNGENYE